MKVKEITPKDYAAAMGWTLQNVTKHLRKGNLHKLPGVLKAKKYSRFYVLEVSQTWGNNSYKKIQSNIRQR